MIAFTRNVSCIKKSHQNSHRRSMQMLSKSYLLAETINIVVVCFPHPFALVVKTSHERHKTMEMEETQLTKTGLNTKISDV